MRVKQLEQLLGIDNTSLVSSEQKTDRFLLIAWIPLLCSEPMHMHPPPYTVNNYPTGKPEERVSVY